METAQKMLRKIVEDVRHGAGLSEKYLALGVGLHNLSAMLDKYAD